MIALTYHPLYDPYHCVFRMLCLFRYSREQIFENDRLRIIDFYVLNPFLIKSMKLTSELRDRLNKSRLDKICNPYQELPKPRILYRRLEGVQTISIRHLAGLGFINRKDLIEGSIRPNISSAISPGFADKIDVYVKKHESVFSFLVNDLSDIPLTGEYGLKHRTELMEHRYDAS